MLNYKIARFEYWVFMGGLFALSFILIFLPIKIPPSVFIFPLLLLAIYRLHDFGRSGWWAGGVFFACAMLTFIGSTFDSPRPSAPDINTLGHFSSLTLVVSFLSQLLFLLTVGIIPGNGHGIGDQWKLAALRKRLNLK